MLDIIIMFVLGQFNALAAKRKGYPGMKFFLRTIAFFILGEFIGSFIIVLLLMSKGITITPELALSTDPQMMLYKSLAIAIAFGGYLFVRRQIEKLPTKQEP